MITYTLSEDVTGIIKGKIYCKQGTLVTLISKYGKVLIVEDRDGERFSVTIKMITPSKLEIIEPEIIIQPVEVKPKKKRPILIQNQNTLF